MILTVKNLSVSLPSGAAYKKVIRGLSFELEEGQILGVVGESGCGKSITNLTLMGLLPTDALVRADRLQICGLDHLTLGRRQWQNLRGSEVAMIFQNPISALNPSLTVEDQLVEVIRKISGNENPRKCQSIAVRLLDEVGIQLPEARLRCYPHQLSGGMAQRVMIAMALACNPRLLIADEPTTALDATTQAQILDLLDSLRRKKNLAIILVSHDFGVVSQYADRIQVMYSGQIVETGLAYHIAQNPLHPYTIGLVKSLPNAKGVIPKSQLATIPGTVPPIDEPIEGCRFYSRCASATKKCLSEPPYKTHPEDTGRKVRCHL